MTKYEAFHLIAGTLYLGAAACMVYTMIKPKPKQEEESDICEDTSFKDGNPVSLTNTEEKIEIEPKKTKKFLDRFKPMAKTVVANKLLNEVLENRDVMVTIHFMKGE